MPCIICQRSWNPPEAVVLLLISGVLTGPHLLVLLLPKLWPCAAPSPPLLLPLPLQQQRTLLLL
jgi:hypothetical protein